MKKTKQALKEHLIQKLTEWRPQMDQDIIKTAVNVNLNRLKSMKMEDVESLFIKCKNDLLPFTNPSYDSPWRRIHPLHNSGGDAGK